MERSVLIGVGVAAAIAVGSAAYLLLKNDESGSCSSSTRGERYGHVSSRQAQIDVKIRSEHAGLIIGRRGDNVRELQRKTNTRIHFKDELTTETHRVLAVKGRPEDAQLAEILIHQIIANQPRPETLVLVVPSHSVGFIIGPNGDTIRGIQNTSRCKITVDRETGSGPRKVTLKGTSVEIRIAKDMIYEKVTFANERRGKKGKDDCCRVLEQPPAEESGDLWQQPLLCLTSENGVVEDDDAATVARTDLRRHHEQLWKEDDVAAAAAVVEVYISSISDPSHFFVQKVGPESIALDKLAQDMSGFYDVLANEELNRVEERLEEGDMVAAKYSADNNWYRARVVSVRVDEYNEEDTIVDLDFVDFGDCDRKAKRTLCRLKPVFLKLKFQAIACSLANVQPKSDDGDWSDSVADEFERLTHSAQWKVMLAKFVDFSAPPGDGDSSCVGKKIPLVELIDASSGRDDVNVGRELAALGLAVYKEP